MKKIPQKLLSLFLVFALAATTVITAFAFTPNSGDIINFWVNTEYKTNKASSVDFVLSNTYADLNSVSNSLACFIYDSDGVAVFDNSIANIEYHPPSEEDGNRNLLYIFFNEPVVLKPNKEYKFVVAAGAFVTASGGLSPEFSVTFLPSEFIYIPTAFDNIMAFLMENHSLAPNFFDFLIQVVWFFYVFPMYF